MHIPRKHKNEHNRQKIGKNAKKHHEQILEHNRSRFNPIYLTGSEKSQLYTHNKTHYTIK